MGVRDGDGARGWGSARVALPVGAHAEARRLSHKLGTLVRLRVRVSTP